MLRFRRSRVAQAFTAVGPYAPVVLLPPAEHAHAGDGEHRRREPRRRRVVLQPSAARDRARVQRVGRALLGDVRGRIAVGSHPVQHGRHRGRHADGRLRGAVRRRFRRSRHDARRRRGARNVDRRRSVGDRAGDQRRSRSAAPAKYVEDDRRRRARAGGGAVDLGLSKDFLGFYTFGLAVQNIGSR